MLLLDEENIFVSMIIRSCLGNERGLRRMTLNITWGETEVWRILHNNIHIEREIV